MHKAATAIWWYACLEPEPEIKKRRGNLPHNMDMYTERWEVRSGIYKTLTYLAFASSPILNSPFLLPLSAISLYATLPMVKSTHVPFLPVCL